MNVAQNAVKESWQFKKVEVTYLSLRSRPIHFNLFIGHWNYSISSLILYDSYKGKVLVWIRQIKTLMVVSRTTDVFLNIQLSVIEIKLKLEWALTWRLGRLHSPIYERNAEVVAMYIPSFIQNRLALTEMHGNKLSHLYSVIVESCIAIIFSIIL